MCLLYIQYYPVACADPLFLVCAGGTSMCCNDGTLAHVMESRAFP